MYRGFQRTRLPGYRQALFLSAVKRLCEPGVPGYLALGPYGFALGTISLRSPPFLQGSGERGRYPGLHERRGPHPRRRGADTEARRADAEGDRKHRPARLSRHRARQRRQPHRASFHQRQIRRPPMTKSITAALLLALPLAAGAAEYLEKTPFQLSRAFSPGVVTEGGKIVWVAGQTATRDNAGNDIANNFEAQVKQVVSQIDQVMKRAGGSLANIVSMTVFIKESRYGDRFVEMRKDMFQNGNYPGSALITVTNFARPGIEIEIQAIGVVGDRCSSETPCSAEGQARKR